MGAISSGRTNDDPIKSRRVELFRLPFADGQPKLRFRFVQTGTSSGHFGIDDFGIYSIPTLPMPRFTGIFQNGHNVTVTWNGEVVSRLQKTTSRSNPVWQNVPGTLGLSSFSEPLTTGPIYYRLRKQLPRAFHTPGFRDWLPVKKVTADVSRR